MSYRPLFYMKSIFSQFLTAAICTILISYSAQAKPGADTTKTGQTAPQGGFVTGEHHP